MTRLVSDYKIYYMPSNFDEGYDTLSPEERALAKQADVILSKDGKVMKDRYDGRRYN